MASAAKGEQEVRQWCADNGLGRFADKFIEQGFDTMVVLGEMENDDLEECGVQKAQFPVL